MTRQWYIKAAEVVIGPVTSSKVRELANGGGISPETLVSPDGDRWVRASRIKGLTFPSGNLLSAPAEPSEDESDAESTCNLAPGEPQLSQTDYATSGSLYDRLDASHLDRLYPTLGSDERDEKSMWGVSGLPLRIGTSATAAMGVATAASVLVHGLVLLGVIELATIAWSLSARVAFPALAFAATFAIVFWWCGLPVKTVTISANMSDEDIAQAIKDL